MAAGGPSSPAYVDLVSTVYTSVNTLNATLRETSGTARVVDPEIRHSGTDFHLRDDSPLVNALGISAVGPTTTDLDGALRDPKLPEPGAYEARSRTITLEAPRVVDATTAQLPTSIRAGLAGTVWWEATPAAGGTPIRFGDTSVAAAVAPTTPTATVSALRPSTEYVVRGYLEDEVGRVTSNEVRLTTPAAPPSAGGTPTPTPTPAIGSPTSTPTSCTVPRLIGPHAPTRPHAAEGRRLQARRDQGSPAQARDDPHAVAVGRRETGRRVRGEGHPSRSGQEAVAQAGLGDEVPRGARRRLELAAQLREVLAQVVELGAVLRPQTSCRSCSPVTSRPPARTSTSSTCHSVGVSRTAAPPRRTRLAARSTVKSGVVTTGSPAGAALTSARRSVARRRASSSSIPNGLVT